MCEDRYGQLLQEIALLEYLYDSNLPVDVSLIPLALTFARV